MRAFLQLTVLIAVSVLALGARANNDPCSEFAASVKDVFYGLDAQLFRKCIHSVPFDATRASKIVSNVRRFIGLDAQLAYYTDPPTPELDLQPFNINKTFDEIESKVKKGAYSNNWSFDYDVVQMFQKARDGHTDYETVCTHGFMYVHNFPITSLVSPGGKTPEIYHVIYDFDADTYTDPKLGSKIKRINGKDVHTYLKDFIKQSPEELNWVDPDARYNAMLFGYPDASSRGRFAYRNMWDGEQLRITWENGTDTMVDFTVSLKNDMVDDGKLVFKDTKSLTDLCFKSKSSGSSPGPKRHKRGTTGNVNGYPAQPVASSAENAMLSYVLPSDKKTAVLVVRTFYEKDLSAASFVKATQTFVSEQISKWKSSGIKRLVIDVTGNPGGKAILPFDMLKQFFPKQNEFSMVNMRYSPVTWAYLKAQPGGDEHTLWRKEDGTEFKDIQDWLGPVRKDGSYFTKMSKQDYLQFGEEDYGVDLNHKGDSLFASENIVIVSDSLCASACHSLVEGFRTRGVRAFAYGGRADTSSPMQAVGGTKGGKVVEYEDARITLANVSSNEAVIAIASDSSDWLLEELPVNVKRLTANSENKFRKGTNLPLQFVYTPACNRFYLDTEMFGSISKMWERTRKVAWDDSGKALKCVDYEPIESGSSASATPSEDRKYVDAKDWASGDAKSCASRNFQPWKNVGQVVYGIMRAYGRDPRKITQLPCD